MLTGEIRNQIDRIWDQFWSGGISNPLEVVEQIIYLLFMRRLDASALYESPFVDYSSNGVDGLFNTAQVDKLISILDDVRQRAAA
jgi:type I restriction enzyme M protein